MNVKLAAQTLSQSVSDSLIYMKNDSNYPSFQDVEGTAKFYSMINTGFVIANSRKLFSEDKWKRGINRENFGEVEKKDNEIIDYVKGLHLRDEEKTPLLKTKKKNKIKEKT